MIGNVGRAWTPGRYRWRTRLRGALPLRPPLYMLIPKGRKDCGNHEWYKATAEADNCYHCRAVRPTRIAQVSDL
jgi:hypothetical protein